MFSIVLMAGTVNCDVDVKVKPGAGMRAGELSEATGVSTRALRYYEEQGLLHSDRLPNGYRDYGQEDVARVRAIQDLFAAGLSSELVREILPCLGTGRPDASCAPLEARVREVRDTLERQEQRIAERRRTLESYLAERALPASSR
jgi:DNA-binding transcriptional MerR regulator